MDYIKTEGAHKFEKMVDDGWTDWWLRAWHQTSSTNSISSRTKKLTDKENNNDYKQMYIFLKVKLFHGRFNNFVSW